MVKTICILLFSCLVTLGQSFTLQDTAFLGNVNLPISTIGPDWTATNAGCWYKANSLVLADGASVTSITDSSGLGYTGYPYKGTSSVSPTFSNNVCGGYPAIHFNSSVTNGLTNVAFALQPFTTFIVGRFSHLASGSIIFDGINAGNRAQAFITASPNYFLELFSGTSTQDSPTANTTNWVVLTVYFNGASSYVRTNGSAWFTVAATPGASGISGYTIGLRYTADTFRINGDIAEFLLYRGTMADGDRNWVEASLKSKYGL